MTKGELTRRKIVEAAGDGHVDPFTFVTIFVDADACPARDEIILVCKRHNLIPIFIANKSIPAIVSSPDAKMEVVEGAFDHIDRDVEAVHLVQDGEFQRRVDVALFLITTHVEVFVVGPLVGQLMD